MMSDDDDAGVDDYDDDDDDDDVQSVNISSKQNVDHICLRTDQNEYLPKYY